MVTEDEKKVEPAAQQKKPEVEKGLLEQMKYTKQKSHKKNRPCTGAGREIMD